jgi:hypothetical protein
MNCLKSAIWIAVFVFAIIAVVEGNTNYSRTRSSISLVVNASLLYVKPYYVLPSHLLTVYRLCFLIPLVYGSIIYHRYRQTGGAYKQVDHARDNQAFSEATGYPSQYTPFVQDHDAESGRVPGARRLSYNHQKDTRFESYRAASYGEASPLETTVISQSPHVPNIHVQHHEGESYEMKGSRASLR